MTEEELLSFVKKPNNKENLVLEYKLKPNFNEINKNIKEIQKRMHFNILKTIYAFANTKGGELYIGIGDKKQTLEGVDECDKEILNKIDTSIKKEKEIIKLKNGRVVIKITVYPLKIYDKPLFVDGILYVREDDTTKAKKSFGDYLALYTDKQLYMCYVRGIKSNLKKLKEQKKQFELDQFIEGLKVHIKSMIEENKIKDEEVLKKAEDLLDNIRQKVIDSIKKPKEASLITSPLDLDLLIDKFIKVYKKIISNRV